MRWGAKPWARRATLVLMVACIILWVVSYQWPADVVVHRGPLSTWFVGVWHGRVELVRQAIEPGLPAGRLADTQEFGHVGSHGRGPSGGMSVDLHQVSGGWLGFQRVRVSTQSGFGTLTATFWFSHVIELWAAPLWSFTAVAAAGFLLNLLWQQRLAKRRDSGQCPRCGYDLRASPERCPECGTVP